jgi:hypothetical protein
VEVAARPSLLLLGHLKNVKAFMQKNKTKKNSFFYNHHHSMQLPTSPPPIVKPITIQEKEWKMGKVAHVALLLLNVKHLYLRIKPSEQNKKYVFSFHNNH